MTLCPAPGTVRTRTPRGLQAPPARDFAAVLAMEVDAVDLQAFEDRAHDGIRAAAEADGAAVQRPGAGQPHRGGPQRTDGVQHARVLTLDELVPPYVAIELLPAVAGGKASRLASVRTSCETRSGRRCATP